MPYLLLADDKTFRSCGWDQLTERLLWAHRQGYGSAKARHTTMDSDRPSCRPRRSPLVQAATELALATD